MPKYDERFGDKKGLRIGKVGVASAVQAALNRGLVQLKLAVGPGAVVREVLLPYAEPIPTTYFAGYRKRRAIVRVRPWVQKELLEYVRALADQGLTAKELAQLIEGKEKQP